MMSLLTRRCGLPLTLPRIHHASISFLPQLITKKKDDENKGSTYGVSTDKAVQLMQGTHKLEMERLAPLNKTLLGPLERRGGSEDRLTSLPFVFLLGNHSSGKSTFINHVLGRTVQETGVAPTDDGFTV